MKLPYSAFLLADRLSLHAYEYGTVKHTPEDIKRRLLILARERDVLKPDYCFESDFNEEQIEAGYESADTLSSCLVRILVYLSKRYLTYLCGQLYVKRELTDEWMELVRVFPPLMIEAAYFIDNEDFEKDEEKFCARFLKPIFKNSALRRPYHRNLEKLVRSEKGLDDLHIHLNGATETDTLWWSQMGHVERWVNSFRKAWYSEESRRQHEQLADATLKEYIGRVRKAKDLLREIIVEMGRADENMLFATPVEFLHTECEDKYPSLVKGAYFYLKLLKLLEQGVLGEKTVYKFHWMALCLGDIHRMAVQQWSQKGFSQFQMIPQNGLRWLQEEKRFHKRFGQLSVDNDFRLLKYIEGRFAPAISLEENIKLASCISKGYELLRREMEKEHMDAPDLRLIAHFIKKEDNIATSRACHSSLRCEVRKKARELWRLNKYLMHKKIRPVVGIDAAANEMHAGPEVFAPAFHWLRTKWRREICTDLHITYHAGEDFRHLLSGLRMMVEAVDFLQMEQGDRIGHGTAAGIEPQLWIERSNAVVNIPQGEWLDDLLMVYEMISDKENPYMDLLSLIPLLHVKIEDLYYEIYGSQGCLGASISEMITAWKYRKYDPDVYLKKKHRLDTEETGEFRKRLQDMEQHQCGMKLFGLYHYDSIVKRKYRKVIPVDIRNGIFTAEHLMHIQNLVLHRIAKKGIALEVLLTSNLAISFYRECKEHHLKRWLDDNSDGDLLIPPVVVGSDDPGIFMTNIYIEYSRISNYLEEHGYGFMERLNVLTGLIQTGKYYSFDC